MTLWNEKAVREELGEEGYEWFIGKVMPRMAACPYCQGKGSVTSPNDLLNEGWEKLGKSANFTKQEVCWYCYAYVEKLTTFCRLRRKIPPVYQNSFLRTLTPYSKSLVPIERQREVIEYIRNHPEEGYCFVGPPNCGKTVMTTALYMEMLWKETVQAPNHDMKASKFFPVWFLSTKQMLDEHTNWDMHKNDPEPEFGLGTPYPTVTVEKIAYVRDHKRTPRLFLEEIDKVKETDARRANLFAVINAIHNYKGQLIVNTNFRTTQFEEVFGDDLAWRIRNACTVVDFFK